MISNLGKTDTEPPDSVLELQCVVSFGPYGVRSGSSPKPDSALCPLVKIHWGLFFVFPYTSPLPLIKTPQSPRASCQRD